MAVAVHLMHRTRGRLRLRAPERRGDAGWLTQAAEMVQTLPGVHSVQAGITTGSLLIHHDPRIELEPVLAGLDLWQWRGTPPPASPPLATLAGLISQVDGALSRGSGGGADLSTLAFLGLVGMGAAQLARGEVMAPAVSMLWYATELAQRAAKAYRRPTPEAPNPGPPFNALS
jgi:hypothetical protein